MSTYRVIVSLNGYNSERDKKKRKPSFFNKNDLDCIVYKYKKRVWLNLANRLKMSEYLTYSCCFKWDV